MKKIILLLFISLTTALNSSAVLVEEVEYSLDTEAKTATVIARADGSPYTGDVKIAYGLNYQNTTYPVTCIDAKAFKDDPITSISLPSKLVEIKSEAFSGCIALKNITIPNSVTTLGQSAFSNCSNLEWAVLSTSLTKIPTALFFGCTNLKSLTLPSSITRINDLAFGNCSGLLSINIPYSLERLFSNTFESCGSLKSISYEARNCSQTDGSVFAMLPNLSYIKFGKSVRNIPQKMFKDCKYITKIELPKSVRHIERYAFEGCSLLADVTFSDSLEIVDTCAFRDCSKLKSAQFNSYLSKINPGAFEYCTSLESVNFAETLWNLSISENAFAYCTSLKTMNLNKNLIEIGDNAFSATKIESLNIPATVEKLGRTILYSNNTIKSIVVDANNKTFDSRDNCNAIIATKANTLVVGINPTVIPNTVEAIGDFAFSGCSLEDIDVPNSVKSIGDQAFYGCSNLTNVTLGTGLQSIGKWAFYNSLNIEKVTANSITPPSCYSDLTFSPDVYTSGQLFVPQESYNDYLNATTWKKFKNISAGVEDIESDNNAIEVERYNINGQKLSQPSHGINIIKMSNGKIKKEFVK